MLTIAMIGQKGLPARSGGIERHVESLARGLASRGHRVVVFGRAWYADDGLELPEGVTQTFTKGIHTKHLDAITHGVTALWKARYYRPDIIHIHGVGNALLAPLARVLHPSAKTVVTFHCKDRLHTKWSWFAKLAFWVGEWVACYASDEVVTVSEELHGYCQAVYDRQAKFISHAFETDKAAPSAQLLDDLGLVPQRYLLFVGRLLPHKGAHRLIRAYAWATQEYPGLFDEIPLVIVGGSAWTDAYVTEVKRLIRETPGVVYLGERHGALLKALQAYALAHVFPTSEEGLSLAILEAATSGNMVVATDIVANKEALGDAGVYVPVNDEKSIGKALAGVLSLPPEERAMYASAQRTYVMDRFDAEKNTDAVIRLYQETMTGDAVLTTPVAAPAFVWRSSLVRG